MATIDEKVTELESSMKKLGLKCDRDLLTAVAKGLGPALFNKDAQLVAASNKEECDRVKKGFLVKKLGLSDGPELDAAIKNVAGQMGKSNRHKQRAIFYYLLVKEFGKESVYA